jgi:hypothetical protein
MCLEQINEVEPKGDLFYKVYVEREGKLFCLVRDLKGQTDLGRTEISINTMYKSEQGFHVWEKREDAEVFALAVKRTKMSFPKKSKFVVRMVKVGCHKSSGTAYKNWKNLIRDEGIEYAQAFRFGEIEVN